MAGRLRSGLPLLRIALTAPNISSAERSITPKPIPSPFMSKHESARNYASGALQRRKRSRYDAIVEAPTQNGYRVCYDGWGNKEEVDPDNVRPIQEGDADPLLEAERIVEATKEALKQKIAQKKTLYFCY